MARRYPRIAGALLTAGLLAGALCAGSAPARAQSGEVVVFAAASLKTALDEIARDWSAGSGHSVVLSYAGSGQLARQIAAGAPADIFISASVAWMDEVEAAGLVVPGTRVDLLGNTLVLIAHWPEAPAVPVDEGLDLVSMLGGGKLAMALVDAVPAGQYGRAALGALGLWDAVSPHVAQADNVRAALALVAAGEAPFGIVYATDAAAEGRVTVVGAFPASSHPPIVYPAALTTAATDEADRAFLAALGSEAARAVFARHGFAVLE